MPGKRQKRGYSKKSTMISKINFIPLVFVIFLLPFHHGYAQENKVYANINEIKIATLNDSILFTKKEDQWCSEAVQNINLTLFNQLVNRLSSHSLEAVTENYSNYEVGSISFRNDSTLYTYHIVKIRNAAIIGYQQTFYHFGLNGFVGNPLVGFVNTDKWFWTDLRPAAGISSIEQIKFKSKVYQNYKTSAATLLKDVELLKYAAHVKTADVHLGKKIGQMKLIHSGGNKKLIFYEKLLEQDIPDTERFYAFVNQEYFECDYYYFNALFNFQKQE